MNNQLVDIRVDEIIVRQMPRQKDGDLTDLQGSIQRIGLLSPILISSDTELIAGGRRLQACRNLGWETIAAYRMDAKGDSLEALDIQTDENLCRLELSDEEQGELIRRKKRRARPKGGTIRTFFKGLKMKLFSKN